MAIWILLYEAIEDVDISAMLPSAVNPGLVHSLFESFFIAHPLFSLSILITNSYGLKKSFKN